VTTRSKLSASALAVLVVLAIAAGSATAAGRACPSTNEPNELVLVAGSGQTAQLGKQFQSNLQVALANSNGCPLTGNLAGVAVDFVAPGSGASGVFAASGSRVAVAGTDPQGIAIAPAFIANDTAGSYSVDAHSDYGTVNLYLSNTASGVATAIAAAAGAGQEATVNSRYVQPLQARVTDANGNPVQGAVVSFAVVPGATGAGASFLGGPGSAATNSNGIATSPPLLANGTPGRFNATASADGLSSVATYALDNHAATMTVTTTTKSDPTATVDSRYRQPLQARVVDASGQPVEGASVTFAISQSDGGAGASFVGGIAQANELTDANGQATSPPLVANKVAGTFTATATAVGARPAGYTLTNLAGRADAIAAGAASGESARIGSRFPVALAVTVMDKHGNPVAGATGVFAAPVHGAGGRFSIRGRKSRVARVMTGSKGIAIAPAFTANMTAGGYVVIAAVKGTTRRAAFALVNETR